VDRSPAGVNAALSSDRDEEVRRLLSEGYARALALDAECVRIVRQLTELAAEDAPREQLRALTARLGDAQRELASLRAQLLNVRRTVDPDGRRF
jgi:hypothetical protein